MLIPLPEPNEEIQRIIYRPDNDEPGVKFWFSDGKTFLNVFGDDEECDAYWEEVRRGSLGEDFIVFHDSCFRPHNVQRVKEAFSSKFGFHIAILFSDSQMYIQKYADEKSMKDDLGTITDILSAFLSFAHHDIPTQ